MSQPQQVNETIGNLSLGSTAVTGFVGLINEYNAVITVFIMLAGFIVGWYYKHKANKRAQEQHDMEKERLRLIGDNQDGASEDKKE